MLEHKTVFVALIFVVELMKVFLAFLSSHRLQFMHAHRWCTTFDSTGQQTRVDVTQDDDGGEEEVQRTSNETIQVDWDGKLLRVQIRISHHHQAELDLRQTILSACQKRSKHFVEGEEKT